MSKLPAIMLYPSDWLDDEISLCSLAAQGLWLRMMFVMHTSSRYGYLVLPNGSPIPPASIALKCGATPEQYDALLTELDSVCRLSKTANGSIYSKRMVEDDRKRADHRKRQHDYANHNKAKENADADMTPPLTRKCSGITSTYSKKERVVPLKASSVHEKAVVNKPLAQSSSELHAEAPPIGTLPCAGEKKSWPLYQAKVDEWQEAYPGVNVVDSLRSARQWLIDNPAKKKTYKGMTRFLNAWLSKQQNEGSRNGVAAASPRYDRSKQNQEAAKRAIDRIVGDLE